MPAPITTQDAARSDVFPPPRLSTSSPPLPPLSPHDESHLRALLHHDFDPLLATNSTQSDPFDFIPLSTREDITPYIRAHQTLTYARMEAQALETLARLLNPPPHPTKQSDHHNAEARRSATTILNAIRHARDFLLATSPRTPRSTPAHRHARHRGPSQPADSPETPRLTQAATTDNPALAIPTPTDPTPSRATKVESCPPAPTHCATSIAMNMPTIPAYSPARLTTLAGTLLVALSTAAPHARAQCGYQLAAGAAASTPFQPIKSILADINRDGRTDLVVACVGAGAISLHTGNPDATFAYGGGWGSCPATEFLTTGDFNEDGWTDVITTGNGQCCLHLNFNGGLGNTSTFTLTGPASGIGAADFNADGHLDLITTHPTANMMQLRLGSGGGAFGSQTLHNAGVPACNPVITDLDGNGRPDVVFGSTTGSSISRVYRLGTSGGGSFGPPQLLAANINQPVEVAVADLNLDGFRDIVAAGTGGNGAPNLAIMLATGVGTYAAPITMSIGSPGHPSLSLADMNQDGRPDIVVGRATELWTILAHSSGSFLPQPQNVAQSLVRGVSLADFNADGKTDAAYVEQSLDRLSVLTNISTFPPTITQHPQSVTTAPGTPASFTAAATSATTYQWRRAGANLAAGPQYSGVNSPTLTILSPSPADNLAIFDCLVFNSCGAATSSPAALGVQEPPASCGSSDFNGDGDFGTDADIEAFFRVLAGGSCE